MQFLTDAARTHPAAPDLLVRMTERHAPTAPRRDATAHELKFHRSQPSAAQSVAALPAPLAAPALPSLFVPLLPRLAPLLNPAAGLCPARGRGHQRPCSSAASSLVHESTAGRADSGCRAFSTCCHQLTLGQSVNQLLAPLLPHHAAHATSVDQAPPCHFRGLRKSATPLREAPTLH